MPSLLTTRLFLRSHCTCKQYTAALVSLLLYLSLGICQGFSAALIPLLERRESKINVTNIESSWMASLFNISMLLGALTAGILMEIYGRKRVIQLAFLPLILGWAIICLSESVFTFYVGRVFTGYAMGMDPAVTVYIAETNTTERRATVQSLAGPIILLGTLISFSLCHFMYWRHTVFFLECFSLICCISLFHIPESPIWLISKNYYEEASRSLKWLRVTDGIADHELLELHNAKLILSEQKMDKLPLNRKIVASKAWKPFFTLVCFFFLQQFTGYHIIFYYAASFYELLGFHTSVDSSSVTYVIFSMFPSFIFSAVVDHYDRRTLSTLSAVGVCITCTMTAMYEFTFESIKEKPIPWFPLVCIFINIGFGFFGLYSLPWVMAGEMFPTQVRGIMTSLLWIIVYFYHFTSLKMYPLIVPFIKIYGVLTIFSIMAFVAILFSIFVLPETRGKTLLEIEKLW